MSNSLISHSEDLSKLIEEGYNIEIRGAYLIVSNVPYLSKDNEIKYAEIVTSLNIDPNTNKTKQPTEHTVWWTGKTPYNSNGESMEEPLCCNNWVDGHDLGERITVYMQWSRKLKQDGVQRAYKDYHEQIVTYVNEVSFHAESHTPGVLESSKLGEKIENEQDTKFEYINSSLYRNGTKGIEDKISNEIVAIIGIGGTGSYLVDILAKTNIKELHLYDDDTIEPSSAFRLAGAVNKNEFGTKKVRWHKDRYKNIRKTGLYTYENTINSSNLEELEKYSTVFIAVDNLESRREIQKKCNELGIFNLSVGIGVELEGVKNNQLGCMIKLEREHQIQGECLKNSGKTTQQPPVGNMYRSNIQIAELNMLGAALAIIEWKIKKGIYRSERNENYNDIIYSTPSGKILMR